MEADPIEIVMTDGRIVRVPPRFDAASLATILDLLERPRSRR
jgi:hypothetical protein